MILMNDLCTALQGVVLRKRMDEKALSSNAIMFYSNICSIPMAGLSILLMSNELTNLIDYQHWGNVYMLFFLLLSAVMGFVINFTYMMCTKYNSPLTTTIVGAFKNIFTSYVGVLFSDFQSSLMVLLGMNTSVVGSLIYNWAEWLKIMENEKTRQHDERHKTNEVAGQQQQQQQQQAPSSLSAGVVSGISPKLGDASSSSGGGHHHHHHHHHHGGMGVVHHTTAGGHAHGDTTAVYVKH
jgi:drug/metabolite transporter (DMT)-like permease